MQEFYDLYVCCSCLEYFETLQKEFFNLSTNFWFLVFKVLVSNFCLINSCGFEDLDLLSLIWIMMGIFFKSKCSAIIKRLNRIYDNRFEFFANFHVQNETSRQ